ncbi:MAG: ankyrin repeat domain-containing protein [Candidatus Dependentiae bacterium]|nr:ankyrin repeat domain-containing protein [Candidatus Dependentiae bacterium]
MVGKKTGIMVVVMGLFFGVMPLLSMQGDPAGTKDIFHAISKGNIQSVKHWLDTEVDINAQDKFSGQTALISAVFKRDVQIVTLLLARGADIEAKNKNGDTALISASGLKDNVEIVALLLARAADIEAKNKNGDTALIRASGLKDNVEIVKLLLARGADIDAKANDGDTPLISAARGMGNVEMVTLLLDHGADIEVKKNNGDTALISVAGWKDSVEMVTLLLDRGADIDAKNNNGDTALISATRGRDNVEMVTLLLNRGADIKVKNNNGDTALISAARGSYNVEMVAFLVDRGIDIEAKNNNGDTALLVAADVDTDHYFQVGYELLRHGADINAVNNKGTSALILVVISGKGLSIIDSLITKWNANPYQVDESGLNAFDYARGNKAIIDILKKTQHKAPVKQEQVEKYQSVLPKAVGRMDHIHRAMDPEKARLLEAGIKKERKDEARQEAEEEKKEAEEAALFLTPTEAHYQQYKKTIEQRYSVVFDNETGVFNNKIAQECLEKERKAYKEGKYVFYRAEPGELRVYEYFIQELYRIIRLYSKQAPFVFTRFFKDAAAQKTINEYVDSVGGKLRDRGELPSMLLSANIPLFGNVNKLGSCTWDYFLQNASVEHIDVQELFQHIFAMYRFDPKYQAQLVEIAQNIQKTRMASLQQIIIPKEVVDNVAMLAQVGYCVPWDEMIDKSCWDAQKERHTKISPLLNKYKDPGFAIDDEWQVRILMNAVYGLNPESGIEFHVYTNNPENIQVKTQNQISEITDKLFTEWLKKELRHRGVSKGVEETDELSKVFSFLGKGEYTVLPPEKQQDMLREYYGELIAPESIQKKVDLGAQAAGQARVQAVFGAKSRLQLHKPANIWEKYAQQLSGGERVLLDAAIMQNLFISDCARDQEQNKYIPEKDKAIARVATYNVHKWLDPKNKDNYQGILDTIKAINADVLVLQEVVFSGGNNLLADFKRLGYEYQVFMDMGNGLHNMIVSKYPFVQEPIKKVYKVDQDSELREKRNFINTRVQLPDGNTLSVYGTHLDVWDESGKKREEEVKELLTAAGADESKNILLAADWNAVRKKDYQYKVKLQTEPQSAAATAADISAWDLLGANFKVRNPKISLIPTDALDAIEKNEFQDSFRMAKVVVNPTYTVWTGTVVDFIFCAPTWQLPVDGSYLYYSSASDHVPVMMDIELNQSGAAVQATAVEEAAESKESAAEPQAAAVQ